jgi:uncharacterized protein YuzE
MTDSDSPRCDNRSHFNGEGQKVMNQQLSDDVVLDVGENDRIIGIETLDASRHLNLEMLLPVKYEVTPEAV